MGRGRQAGVGQGLRGRRGVRRRRQARLRQGRRGLGPDPVRHGDLAGSQGLRLQRAAVLDHRRAEEGGRLSSPYYVTAPALVSIKGHKGADATNLADLKDVDIGAAVGTTTFTAVEEAIAPNKKVQPFNSNEDAVQALRTTSIDVLAVDLPTALYLANAELDNGVVVGQLDSDQGGDQFGLLLDPDPRLGP